MAPIRQKLQNFAETVALLRATPITLPPVALNRRIPRPVCDSCGTSSNVAAVVRAPVIFANGKWHYMKDAQDCTVVDVPEICQTCLEQNR